MSVQAARAVRLVLIPRLLVGAAAVVWAIDARDTDAAAQQPLGRSPVNTWSARTSSGRTLSGTWTVKIDPATGSAVGDWTLFGADGRTAARGGWSAAKSPAGWSGAWRTVVVGRNGEFAGTWKGGADLPADAPLARLFERAAETVMSGSWQMGRQSGAWSIRASN